METESIYEGDEEEQVRELQTPGIQAELDKHCAVISSADSIQDMINAHTTAVNGWLRNEHFPTSSFEHDHGLIVSIMQSVAHRRLIHLLLKTFSPEIQAEMGRYCLAISSANSSKEIKSVITSGAEWADSINEPDKLKKLVLKSAMDMSASRRLIALMIGLKTREEVRSRGFTVSLSQNLSAGNGGKKDRVIV